jgi:hypothetical protein
MGLSFEEIAEQITRVGQGKSLAMVTVPPGVTFPEDYSISRQACHQHYSEEIARQPSLELDALRKLYNARFEEMYLNLQSGIRKGHERAIEAGAKVLGQAARINGIAAPQRDERTPLGDSADRVSIAVIRKIIDDNRPIHVTPSPPEFRPKDVETGSTASAFGAADDTKRTSLGGPYTFAEIRKMQKDWGD